MQFKDIKGLEDFFFYNDVGIPLAQAFDCGLCELLPEGENAINETWNYLCMIGKKDPNSDDYDNISDILDLPEDDE